MCAYSVFNTFPVYPLSAKPLILLAFCRYRYHTSLFDRPGFQKMLDEIESGNVAVCITKDLSRLGRNSAMTGLYTNITFPKHGVRYIAISDNFDTSDQNGMGIDMAGIKNWINEFYARDTSRKIRAVNKSKGSRGIPLTTNVPYGYMKNPDDPTPLAR